MGVVETAVNWKYIDNVILMSNVFVCDCITENAANETPTEKKEAVKDETRKDMDYYNIHLIMPGVPAPVDIMVCECESECEGWVGGCRSVRLANGICVTSSMRFLRRQSPQSCIVSI